MVLPIIFGAAQAGLGIASAFSNYSAGQRQAAQANEASAANYRNLLRQREFDWRSRLSIYNQQMAEYNQSEIFDREGLQRGYRGAQDVLTDEIRSMRVMQEQQNIARAQNIGSIMARGQTGVSASRNVANIAAAYGRNQAMMAQNLLGARNRYAYDVEGLRRDYQSARNRAYSRVAVAPQLGPAPDAPEMLQGPSQASLFADIGSSVLSGIGTGMSLSAESPFKNTPRQGFDLNQNFFSGGPGPAFGTQGIGVANSSGFNLNGFGPLNPLTSFLP